MNRDVSLYGVREQSRGDHFKLSMLLFEVTSDVTVRAIESLPAVCKSTVTNC